MAVAEQHASGLEDALASLRSGGFVLLHDASSRENEVDMVAAAEFVSPEHVKVMRSQAGGLLCVALSSVLGDKFGLVRMHELFLAAARRYPMLRFLDEDETPYGGRPAFSITVNHRSTFTGVTDIDRARTVLELANLSKKALASYGDSAKEFAAEFKAPGHVHLLLEADDSLRERRGHTELSVYLCGVARLTPAAVICEMLDGTTYKALSFEEARKFAGLNSIPVIEAEQVLEDFLSRNRSHGPLQSVRAWNPTSN